MPRPNKAFRRQKINAAIAWKRGDRKEAYKLWEQAAKNTKEHRAQKHNKKKAEQAAAEPAAAAESPGTAE